MSHFGVYWKNFVADCEHYGYDESKPLFDWRTNSERLFQCLRPADWVWFFANGTACGMPEKTSGFLVNLYQVESMVTNKGDDPYYPSADFAYTIWADRAVCYWVDPPLFVDDIIRPVGRAPSLPIGRLWQGPRMLSDAAVARMQDKLRRERGVVVASGFP